MKRGNVLTLSKLAELNEGDSIYVNFRDELGSDFGFFKVSTCADRLCVPTMDGDPLFFLFDIVRNSIDGVNAIAISNFVENAAWAAVIYEVTE